MVTSSLHPAVQRQITKLIKLTFDNLSDPNTIDGYNNFRCTRLHSPRGYHKAVWIPFWNHLGSQNGQVEAKNRHQQNYLLLCLRSEMLSSLKAFAKAPSNRFGSKLGPML